MQKAGGHSPKRSEVDYFPLYSFCTKAISQGLQFIYFTLNVRLCYINTELSWYPKIVYEEHLNMIK